MNKDELKARCEAYYTTNFPGVDAVEGLPGLEAFARALVVQTWEEVAKLIVSRSSLWRRHGGAKIESPYNHLTVEGELDVIHKEIIREIQRIKEGA